MGLKTLRSGTGTSRCRKASISASARGTSKNSRTFMHDFMNLGRMLGAGGSS